MARVVVPVGVALLPVAAMHLLLGLPDGSCRLSRAAIVGGYVLGAAVGVAMWTRRPALPLWPVGVEVVVFGSIGVIGSQRRYARSRGVERQRMQWFGWAIAVGAEILVVALALRVLWGWPTRPWLVVMVSSLPLAVALAMGSSRRLAGRIDRILAHTVSLAGLTGIVVVVYLVIVVGLGHTPTHDQRSLLALSMAAAAVAALLYGPARQRLTQYANRIVYGEREAPDTVVRTFGSRLSRAIPMDELLLQVAESLRKTLGLSAAEVWTGSGGHLERTVSVPDVPVQRLTLNDEESTVVARAGVTGTAWVEIWLPSLLRRPRGLRGPGGAHDALGAGPRPHRGGAAAQQRARSRPTTTPCSPSWHARSVWPCTTWSSTPPSRSPWTRSGARPTSCRPPGRASWPPPTRPGARSSATSTTGPSSTWWPWRSTSAWPASSPSAIPRPRARSSTSWARRVQEAVQELRALAHGIYPPLLIDRGIAEALRSGRRARRAAHRGRRRRPRPLLPEREAAVYFCCIEALQNAGKHAGDGATAFVRVWEDDANLFFEVRDTGAGFDANGIAGQRGRLREHERPGGSDRRDRQRGVQRPARGPRSSGCIPIGA